MCIDLGLHRLSKVSELERETRARVWWNCYVLDKLRLTRSLFFSHEADFRFRALAEETGHPHQLRSLNCTTPFPSALEADEFELWPTVTPSLTPPTHPMSPSSSSTMHPHHHPHQHQQQQQPSPTSSSSTPVVVVGPRQPCRGHIISTFVSTCKLAMIVESIMDMHAHLSLSTSSGGTAASVVDDDSSSDGSIGRRLQMRDELDRKLEEWKRDQQVVAPLGDGMPLPHVVINESVSARKSSIIRADELIRFLPQWYHAAQILLHSRFIQQYPVPANEDDGSDGSGGAHQRRGGGMTNSHSICTRAADSIVELVTRLDRHRMLGKLPADCINILSSAALVSSSSLFLICDDAWRF
jgi:hypothetical protein